LIGKEEARVLGIANVEQKVQWMAETSGERFRSYEKEILTCGCREAAIANLLLDTNLYFHVAGIDEIRACANIRFFRNSVIVGRADRSASFALICGYELRVACSRKSTYYNRSDPLSARGGAAARLARELEAITINVLARVIDAGSVVFKLGL
jgi:hypothetical protein